MRSVWIAALVISLCASVCADTSRFSPPDPRLEKKVTIEVDHTKLEDVAKSLSEQSGVTVTAGTGTRDWKVRERHITIRAKDMPLGKMMDEITGVLGYYLSREGKEGEWTYIVWQDKKSRDLEAEMVTAAKEAAAQRAKETRQSAVDAANKALKMTPEDALKNRDKDPLGAYMGGTKSGRGFAQLLSSMQSQFPTEYDLMMRGKRAFVPMTGLPPNLSQATADATSGGLGAAMRAKGGADASSQPTPYQLIFMPLGGSESFEASLMGVSGLMFITGLTPGQKPTTDGNPFGGGQPMGMFPLAGENSPFGKLFGKMLFALDEGVPLDEVNKQMGSQVEDPSFLADILARKSPTEESPPTDPKLTREIEIDTKDLPAGISAMMGGGKIHESQGKATAEISRALGMPVLLESFNMSMPIALFIKPGKQPVYRVMVALEKAGYKWTLGEDALRVRPEDWALKRSHEIPESVLAYYKKLLETQGELTLDDLAQMANTLTDEQIQNTLSKDEDLNYAVGTLGGDFLGGNRDTLRFYAALTPAQKEALSSESGLPFGQLSDSQWERVSAVITDRLGGLDITDGSVLLRPQPEEAIKSGSLNRTFEIAVQVNGEQEPRKMYQTIRISDKQQIAQIKEARKKAQEAMQKAAEQKKADQTPPPAQTQPAPAK